MKEPETISPVERRDGGSRDGHIRALELRRFRARELEGERATAVAAHTEACADCRARLAAIDEEQRQFTRDIPWDRFAAGVERAGRELARTGRPVGGAQKAGRAPQTARLLRFATPLLGLAAAAIVLIVVRPRTPDDARHNARKGGAEEIVVRIGNDAVAGARTANVDVPTALARGERLRIGYRTESARFLVVLSLDDAGVVTPIYPETGRALAAPPSPTMTFLPDGIELTGRGKERLFVTLFDAPVDVETAATALREAARRTHAPLGEGNQLPAIFSKAPSTTASYLFEKP